MVQDVVPVVAHCFQAFVQGLRIRSIELTFEVDELQQFRLNLNCTTQWWRLVQTRTHFGTAQAQFWHQLNEVVLKVATNAPVVVFAVMELGQANEYAFRLSNDDVDRKAFHSTFWTQVLDLQNTEVSVALDLFCLCTDWVHRQLVAVQQRLVGHYVPDVVRQRVETTRHAFQNGVTFHTSQVTLVGRVHLHLDDVTNVSCQNEVGARLSSNLWQLVEQLVLRLTVGHGVGVVLRVANFVLGIHLFYSSNVELRERVNEGSCRVKHFLQCAVNVLERRSPQVGFRIFGLSIQNFTKREEELVTRVLRQVSEHELWIIIEIDVCNFWIMLTDRFETGNWIQCAFGVVDDRVRTRECTASHRHHVETESRLEVVWTRHDTVQCTQTAVQNHLAMFALEIFTS